MIKMVALGVDGSGANIFGVEVVDLATSSVLGVELPQNHALAVVVVMIARVKIVAVKSDFILDSVIVVSNTGILWIGGGGVNGCG